MRKEILCFGDSNTWGYTPGTGVRYAPDVRWTGVMAQVLGENYHIIEDGLNGRTTSFDFPWSECRNGQSALPYALLSNKPLDLLILALGINDLTVVDSGFSAKSVAALIRKTRMLQAVPDSGTSVFPNGEKILIAAPAPVHPDYDRMYAVPYYEDSCRLAEKYRIIIMPCAGEPPPILTNLRRPHSTIRSTALKVLARRLTAARETPATSALTGCSSTTDIIICSLLMTGFRLNLPFLWK